MFPVIEGGFYPGWLGLVGGFAWVPIMRFFLMQISLNLALWSLMMLMSLLLLLSCTLNISTLIGWSLDLISLFLARLTMLFSHLSCVPSLIMSSGGRMPVTSWNVFQTVVALVQWMRMWSMSSGVLQCSHIGESLMLCLKSLSFVKVLLWRFIYWVVFSIGWMMFRLVMKGFIVPLSTGFGVPSRDIMSRVLSSLMGLHELSPMLMVLHLSLFSASVSVLTALRMPWSNIVRILGFNLSIVLERMGWVSLISVLAALYSCARFLIIRVLVQFFRYAVSMGFSWVICAVVVIL